MPYLKVENFDQENFKVHKKVGIAHQNQSRNEFILHTRF